jgi:hypothetical protein
MQSAPLADNERRANDLVGKQALALFRISMLKSSENPADLG